MASQNTPLSQSGVSHDAERVNWLDYAKGIGIFWVVLGHTLRGLNDAVLPPSPLLEAIDQWIYAFHMPLFFFISGLLAERLAVKSLRQIIINRLQMIVYPYIIWSVLQEILRSITGSRTEPIADLWQIVYQPMMQFWFLYVLAIASLAYALLRKSHLPPSGFFILSLLLYLAHCQSINFGDWGVLYMVRMNLLYFGLGAAVNQTNWLVSLEKLSSLLLLSLTLGGFVLIALAVMLGIAEKLEIVPILATVGIGATCALARWLDRWGEGWMNRILREWGMLSLQIFVAHTIFSAIARTLLLKLQAPPALHILLGTAVGIYGSIWLYRLCQRLNFPYAFSLRPVRG
jgi:fucose 4-O-acetylase-like acetyltransferase